jgi:phosphoribosylamine--glycine ligase
MGTFSPSTFYTKDIDAYCMEHIYKPTMAAMKKEGRSFTGILFFGLMLTDKGPIVIEYNARFGDPETQVVLPRLKNDIIEIFEACVEERLSEIRLDFEDNAAVCVVLASKGYPLSYEKGFPIEGLDKFKDNDSVFIFHAGTANDQERIVTAGGRVLGVTATGSTLKEARENAYKAAEAVTFTNKYARSDIGKAIDEA